ncbi:MAG: hypothetical protein ACI920_004097 [Saprospiraceae bacterium]|jgi:hypothetical protein
MIPNFNKISIIILKLEKQHSERFHSRFQKMKKQILVLEKHLHNFFKLGKSVN